MLTKAFFTEDEAEQEAARLNAQNEEYWSYFVRVARLVPEGAGLTSRKAHRITNSSAAGFDPRFRG